MSIHLSTHFFLALGLPLAGLLAAIILIEILGAIHRRREAAEKRRWGG